MASLDPRGDLAPLPEDTALPPLWRSAADPLRATRDRALTVAELNRRAQDAVEGLGFVWVVGEVSGLKASSPGHLYFSLRDADGDDACVECVMWRRAAQALAARPVDGDRVRVWGRPTVYGARGRYQFVVHRLRGDGDGWWQRAVEALRAKLAAEGLLAPERKRPLPPFPRRLAVVTSRYGAAVRDVVAVVGRRAPWVELVVVDCRVQGDDAAADIVRALRAAAGVGADAILLTRGGGAREELWVFNDEDVVRAVAALPVPVICAVGHETDVTLAELVADRRAPTPSAAAVAATPDGAELRRRLAVDQQRLARAVAQRLEDRRQRLARQATLLAQRWQDRTAAWRQRLAERAELMRTFATAALDRRRQRLAALTRHLDDLSPLRTLSRGYGLPVGSDGRLLRRPEDFPPGSSWRLLLTWGSVVARTDRVDLQP